MKLFWNKALLGAALMAPLALTPMALKAENHKAVTYHDKEHNDDHEWNSHENRAYRVYTKQNHRRNTPFLKLKENDQQAYWGWRHDHSDAQLNINIR